MSITLEYLNSKLPFDISEMIAKKVCKNRIEILEKKRKIFIIWYNNTYFDNRVKLYTNKKKDKYVIYNTNKLLRNLDNYGFINL